MANGVNGAGKAGRISRTNSEPNLQAQAATSEALQNLRQGLQRHNSAGDLQHVHQETRSGGGHSDREPQETGLNPQQGGTMHEGRDLSGGDRPVSQVRVTVNNGTPDSVTASLSGLVTPVKNAASQAVSGTSPLRNVAPSPTAKEGIRRALEMAFSPSGNIASAGSGGGLFGSPISNKGTGSLSPEKIANKMVDVYHAHADNNLDLFLETFGEVLAEKATDKPDVFHAFFQKQVGGGMASYVASFFMTAYAASMGARFADGFSHHLQTIADSRLATRQLNPSNAGQEIQVDTAKLQILHANIGGGQSCMQSLCTTLENLGKDPMTLAKANLIQDLAEILMSATNRGDLSDSGSGISVLRSALLASPELAAALVGTPAGNAIAISLETDYNTQVTTPFPIADIAHPEHIFHKTLQVARVLDMLSPLAAASNLNVCVMNEFDPADPPITLVPTREAALYLRITFPPMATDFSNIRTRAELDGSEAAYKNSLSQLVGDVYPPSTGQNPAEQTSRPSISTAFRDVLSLFFHKANTQSHDINNKKAVRLQELQDAFTEKLDAGIVLPATRDGDWQTAANSLRELNAAFVDLYRDGEDGYDAQKQALTALANQVMNAYAGVVGAQLATASNPPINGEFNAKLREIDTRLEAHTAYKTRFSDLFAGDGILASVRDAKLTEVQRPIDALLARKVEVADAKLTASTDSLKGALKTLYIVLGKDQATAFADAETEATRRKDAASRSILTGEGPNTQANTTSAAADGLDSQSRDISNIARAYTSAQQQFEGILANTNTDLQDSNATTINERGLTDKENELDQVLTAAINRFKNIGSTDTVVNGIIITLEQDRESALRTGQGLIHDFAASGIQIRTTGESNADRLAYIRRESTRLGRFLPASTREEGETLAASEQNRLVTEASDAARAAALNKASRLADIAKSKEALAPIREALDDIRGRRPEDEVRHTATLTDDLRDRLAGLPELQADSSEREIADYQTAIGLYQTGMTTELAALQAAQQVDLDKTTKFQGIHTAATNQYNAEIATPHTPSADLTRLSEELSTQGDKPYASTMRDLETAIRADIQAMRTARTGHTEQLSTANRDFGIATSDLKTALQELYTATDTTENSETKANEKAAAAKRQTGVANDRHIDVQTEHTNDATALLTGETAQIRGLTETYTDALSRLETIRKSATSATDLRTQTDTLLDTFDGDTAAMPAAERTLARKSLSTKITEARRVAATETANAAIDQLNTKKIELAALLTQKPASMAERSQLLQNIVAQFQDIRRESSRLFPSQKTPEGQASKTYLTKTEKAITSLYTQFCDTDSRTIADNARASLDALSTAASNTFENLATGSQQRHNAARTAFETAYTIEGLDFSPMSDALAASDIDFSEIIDTRRAQFVAIRDAHETIRATFREAFETATTGIDFNTVTAENLRNRTKTYNDNRLSALTTLRDTLADIPEDTDQSLDTFKQEQASKHEELKAVFTTRVSSSLAPAKADLATLGDDSTLAELKTKTEIAVKLQTRATDLKDFLTPGLGDEINGMVNTHFTRVITAATTAVNDSIDSAIAASQHGIDTNTATSVDLNTRMSTLSAAIDTAETEFQTTLATLPDSTALQTARDTVALRILGNIPATVKAQIQTVVSAPLTTLNTELTTALGKNPSLTGLQALKDKLDILTNRRDALTDDWLQPGLAEDIQQTAALYASKLAMRTLSRAEQLTALTEALAGLTFALPENTTLSSKWTIIQDTGADQIALQESEDFFELFHETPKDLAITASLAQLEIRRNAAIDNHAPERQALTAGLAGQLDTLVTAGFNWDTAMTAAETVAKGTLSPEMHANAEIQRALTVAKRNVDGLRPAVFTRVAAREAFETATASLSGWPASGASLSDIQAEITAARTAFTNKNATTEFATWDATTDTAITTLQNDLNVAVGRRDTMIGQLQAIGTAIGAVRSDSLANRWTDIAAQETAFGDLQKPGTAHAAMLADPEVSATLREIRTELTAKSQPTSLEKSSFNAGMNAALLNPALTTADAVLNNAHATVTARVSTDIQNLTSFQNAMRSVQTAASTDLTAVINTRLTYRQTLTAAAGVLTQVQARAATGADLQTAITTIGAPPVSIMDNGIAVFETCDVAMATQKSEIEAGLVAHDELVTAFETAIGTATGQLPTIDRTTTANAKWTALKTAKSTYDTAYANADYLFGDLFTAAVHPDINDVDSGFDKALHAVINDVTPELSEIRTAAAAALLAFVKQSDGNNPPTFDGIQNGVLTGAGVLPTDLTAVQTAITNNDDGISAEIKSRVDLHTAILAYPALPTAEKSEEFKRLRSQSEKLYTNDIYKQTDTMLINSIRSLEDTHATTIQTAFRGHVDRVAFAKTEAAAQSLAEKMSRDLETALAQKMGFTGTAITDPDALLTECKNAVIVATSTVKPKPSLDVQELALAKLDTQLKSNGLTTAITTRLAQRSAIMACLASPNPATLRVIPAADTRNDYASFATLDAAYDLKITELTATVSAKKADFIARFSELATKITDATNSDSLEARWTDLKTHETTLTDLQTEAEDFAAEPDVQTAIDSAIAALTEKAKPTDLERQAFAAAMNAILLGDPAPTDASTVLAQSAVVLPEGLNTARFTATMDTVKAEILPNDVSRRIHYRAGVTNAQKLLTDIQVKGTSAQKLKDHLDGIFATGGNSTFIDFDTNMDAKLAEIETQCTVYLAGETANASIDAAIETVTKDIDPDSVTADDLIQPMDDFSAAITAITTMFTDAIQGIPRNQAMEDIQAALASRRATLDGDVRATIKAVVSPELASENDAITALLNDPKTTLADLNAAADRVNTLATRRTELGEDWLTTGLPAKIDVTTNNYDLKVTALRSREGQIQALSSALDAISFSVPNGATLSAKWTDIAAQINRYAALIANQDYATILAEEPKDKTLTRSLARFDHNKTTAIGNHAPETAGIISGLAAQLGTLPSNFTWTNVLTNAEASAIATLPAELQNNAEMKATFATLKMSLGGLEDAVRTRVTARTALDTGTASLAGWPSSGTSLDDIQTEITKARTAFSTTTGAGEFAAWDIDTDQAITALEEDIALKIESRRDLLAQLGEINTAIGDIRSDSLENRWADIQTQDTALTTLKTNNTEMLKDPDVKLAFDAAITALSEKAKPTDLERKAFADAINTVLLSDPILSDSSEVFAQAQNAMTAPDTVTTDKFAAAITTGTNEFKSTHATAVSTRLAYRQSIITAESSLEQVQNRTAKGSTLRTAIGNIPTDLLPINNAEGANIFLTFDGTMGVQKAAVETGLAEHTALVTAFTDALGIATTQLPTAPPTAGAKWTAINRANTTYAAIPERESHLFKSDIFDDTATVHPDIQTIHDTFNQKVAAAVKEVTPEIAEIRTASATALLAFVQQTNGDNPPTFDGIQAGVLTRAGILPADLPAVQTAIGKGPIQANIDARIDIATKVHAYESATLQTEIALAELETALGKLSNPAVFQAVDTALKIKIETFRTERNALSADQRATQMYAEVETAIAAQLELTSTLATSTTAQDLLDSCKNAVMVAATSQPFPSLAVQESAFRLLNTKLNTPEFTDAIYTRIDQRSALMACQANPNPATLSAIPAADTRSNYGVAPNKPFAVLDAAYDTEITRLTDIVTAKKSDLITAFNAIKDTVVPADTLTNRWTAIAKMDADFADLDSVENQPYFEFHQDNRAIVNAQESAALVISGAKDTHALELNTMKAAVIAKLTAGGPLDRATVLREAKETATNSIDAAHQALASDTLTAAATELETWYDTQVSPRVTWQTAIATAESQKDAIESRTAAGDTLIIPVLPAPLPTDGTSFDAYDATLTDRVTDLSRFKADHEAAVLAFNTAIGVATTQLTPGDATAVAKWTAINTATSTYDTAYANTDYLFGDRLTDNAFHPDILDVDAGFDAARQTAINKVAPELAGIRNAAATALEGFVKNTGLEPTFSGLRDGVLKTDLGLKDDNLTAVKTAITNNDDGIPAEIKARVDLHKAILAYPALKPSEKSTKLAELNTSLAGLSGAGKYAAADAILTANINALSTATTKDNTSLQSMAQTWHSLEESLRTQSNPKAKYTMRLDDALTTVLGSPETAANYISELTATCETLLAIPGLSTDHHAILTRSLAHITNRNTPPPLCAHTLSASLRTILGIMDDQIVDITNGAITLRIDNTQPPLLDALYQALPVVSNKQIIVPIRPDTDEMHKQLALGTGGMAANVLEVRTWFDAQSADTLGYIDYLGYKAMHADSEDTLNTTLDELSRASALLRNNGTGIETHRTFGDAEAAIRDAKNPLFAISFEDRQAQAAEAARLLVEAYNEAMKPVEVEMKHAEDLSTPDLEAMVSLEAVVGLTPQHGVPPHSTVAGTFDMDGFIQLLYSKKALGVTIAAAANRHYASTSDINSFLAAIQTTGDAGELHTLAESISADMFRTSSNAPINFGNYIQDVWTQALVQSPPIPNAAELLKDALKYLRLNRPAH